MTQKEIMQLLDSNPEIMNLLNLYHDHTQPQNAGGMDQAGPDKIEDTFLDMICNPLFWFERWMEKDTESKRKEAEDLKGGFRQRFPDLPENSPLELLYVAFAAGFEMGVNLTIDQLSD